MCLARSFVRSFVRLPPANSKLENEVELVKHGLALSARLIKTFPTLLFIRRACDQQRMQPWQYPREPALRLLDPGIIEGGDANKGLCSCWWNQCVRWTSYPSHRSRG